MFASNATSSALETAVSPVSGTTAGWMMDQDQATNDVLDYTSFSDDSHSPVLSIQSFASSQQHSPDLDAYCFQDFEHLVHNPSSHAPAPSATGSTLQSVLEGFNAAAPVMSSSSNNDVKTSPEETTRQAALLHAYLAAQNQAYTAQLQIQQQQQQQQQEQWNMAALVQMQQQESNTVNKDIEVIQQKALDSTQKSDAENLARYLAHIRQVKEEEEEVEQQIITCSNEAMDHAEASESVHAPSSPSSTSSVMAERSPSPEAPSHEETNSAPAKNANCVKTSTRQLICFNCNVTQTPLWRRTPDRQHSLCNACGLYYKQYGAHRPLNVRHKLPTVLADPRAHAMPYGRSSFSSTRGSSPSGPESSDSDSDSGRRSSSSSSNDATSRSLPDLTKMYADALIRPAVAQKTTPPLMTAKQGIECANCSQTQTPLWRKNEAGEPICNACGLYAKLHNRARPVTMRKSKITRRRRDWGGNLAHQAQAQAQALAMFHAQVQAQVEAQVKGGESASVEVSMVQEMSRRALELNSRPTLQSPVHSSDSEEEQPEPSVLQKQQQKQQPSASATGTGASGLAQKLSGNLIMDEHKFSDVVGQMNAHQMNRFLSILETRCGVLRNRILASTEGSAQDSSLDNLF